RRVLFRSRVTDEGLDRSHPLHGNLARPPGAAGGPGLEAGAFPEGQRGSVRAERPQPPEAGLGLGELLRDARSDTLRRAKARAHQGTGPSEEFARHGLVRDLGRGSGASSRITAQAKSWSERRAAQA